MVFTDPRAHDNPAFFVNDAFCALVGYPREEILGRNCRFLQGPKTDAETVRLVGAAVRAGLAITVDLQNHRKDGEAFWNRMHIEPVHDAQGVIIHFIASQVDITLERDRLASLESHNAILAETAERLADRSRELLEANERLLAEAAERGRIEEKLRQAQKMDAIGQLTGGIAHDFNNLLAGIIGSLELIQKRVAAGRMDGIQRYTSAAVTSAQRAAALTQRLLAFARRQPLDPKWIDVNRLVAGMEDLLRRTLGPGIRLEIVLSGGLWLTLCDPNQLENAILNLAINARDAMPEGGRLTVETVNTHLDDAYARAQAGEVQAGQYVAVSVTDTGTGMSPEIIGKVFDPFFTTKSIGQGTGLGLSMLYGFVKQSEGHVRIYSEIGTGTTFKLYLPRFRGGIGTESEGIPEIIVKTPRAEAGQTVLVVDDEAALRMLVTETLQDLGYAAIEAEDGPAGLRILESERHIDLLVTDIGLPGMNGRQLADAARALRPDLKILFVTGYAHNAVIGGSAPLEPGMQMLTKPFALDALAKKIHDMIEQV